MKMRAKRVFTFLISLSLALGMILGMSLTAQSQDYNGNDYVDFSQLQVGDSIGKNVSGIYCDQWWIRLLANGYGEADGSICEYDADIYSSMNNVTLSDGIFEIYNAVPGMTDPMNRYKPMYLDANGDAQDSDRWYVVDVQQDEWGYKAITLSGDPNSISTPVGVSSVTLDPPTTQTIYCGGYAQFTATVAPVDAENKTVVWSVSETYTNTVILYSDSDCTQPVGSDATDILTVYAKGNSVGNATITCTSNSDASISASCGVTVANPPAEMEYTLELKDSVGVNFYMNDLDGDAKDYQIAYGTGATQTDEWKVETPTNTTKTQFVIGDSAAKEMGDEIHVIVTYQGNVIKDAYYSVKSYCETVINGDYDNNLKNLCKATLDFGRYAQKYFNHNTDNLVHDGDDYFTNENIVVPSYDATKTDNSEHVTGVYLSLVTTAKTQLVVRFQCGATNLGGYSATIDGDVAQLTLEDDMIKVVKEGIAAKDLNVKHTFVLTDPDGGTCTYEVSPVDYMAKAVQLNEYPALVSLNRAFYNYYL